MKIEHGGNAGALAKRFGYLPEDCIDFSANINPLGISQKLQDCLLESIPSLAYYPDADYIRSRTYIARYHGQPADCVLIANGAVDIFYELARYFQPARLLLLSPTFMEYEKAFSQVGSEMLYHVLSGPDYQWNFTDILSSLLLLSEGDAVLICNPNNPTGSLVSAAELRKIAEFLAKRKVILIIDEAFVDFLENEQEYSFISSLQMSPNSIVVRSLTKFHAVPGLRLGYAVTHHPACLPAIETNRPPWTVTAFADKAVPVILADKDYQEQTRQWLLEEKEFLFRGLSEFPELLVTEPAVNYIFFECRLAIDLRKALWRRKIFIRSCRNYHQLTERHYRVAVKGRDDNAKLLEALKDIFWKEAGNEMD